MLVLGVGIGLCMQVLTIIVQNTVDYRDLGVATSGVTFFRTLGSSFGAAVFGTIYANVLGNSLPAAVAASPGARPGAIATPAGAARLPPAQIAPIVDAYAHAIHVVFLAAVPVALVAFVLALFLKEVPLRGTSREAAPDVGEGFGMPEAPTPTSSCRPRSHESSATRAAPRPKVRQHSGAAFGASDGWSVGQVYLRHRLGRTTTTDEIATLYHLPPEVLDPAFEAAVAHGYLTKQDGHLDITEAGTIEVDKLAAAFKAWLASELAHWGPDDPG